MYIYICIYILDLLISSILNNIYGYGISKGVLFSLFNLTKNMTIKIKPIDKLYL